MTYTIEKKRVGRRPFEIVVLKLDYCTLSYGVDPCTAGRVQSATATAGSSTTITLSAGASAIDGTYIKHAIVITAGTGVGQERIVASYVGATKVATMTVPWGTAPDATSQYTVINRTLACYNTRATCQNIANYTPSTTLNNYWFTTQSLDLPKSLSAQAGAAVVIPCLRTVDRAPTRITLGTGLGYRASITATFKDFPHHDRGTDKYTASRLYNPLAQGTFWGKFLNRNRFYQGRELQLYTGYLTEAGDFDALNFQVRTYVIEKADGPNSSDIVTFNAKDPLKFAENDRSNVPEPTLSELGVAIIDTTLGVVSVTNLDTTKYAASGFVRAGKEVMAYSARTATTITLSARAQWGTTAAKHALGDNLQYCVYWTSVNVVTILQQLLDIAYQTTPGFGRNAGIETTQLDLIGWANEQASWLGANNLTRLLYQPTGVSTLLNELVESNLFYMWWDELARLVRMKAIAPNTSLGTLTDRANFLASTTIVKDDPSQRVSQVWVWYTPLDITETSIWNFQNLYVQVDTAAEDPDEYDDSRVKTIESLWIPSGALAIQLAGRTLTLLRDNPRVVNFSLDAKDSAVTGDVYTLDSRNIQSFDGSNLQLPILITEAKEVQTGSTVEYIGQEFVFTGRYGRIGFDDVNFVVTATANTITFAATASAEDQVYLDHVVSIVSGTGAGQTNTVVSYIGATRLASVLTPWSVVPDVTSVYDVTLPDYSGDFLLLETGDFLITELGSFFVVEASTGGLGATDAQKLLYAWLSPVTGAGKFTDGSNCYKIN